MELAPPKRLSPIPDRKPAAAIRKLALRLVTSVPCLLPAFLGRRLAALIRPSDG